MKPTIRAMQVREAKDFLVAQTAEQAALEGVPLSDLEKRMMYFTEGPDAVEDPVKLNDEFEAQYDSKKFETKIAKLLHHAHARIKKENAGKTRLWGDAIRALRKGDHYILVLWGAPSRHGGSSKLPIGVWAFTLFILTLAVAVKPFMVYLMKTSARPAHPQLLLVIFLGMIAASFLFPRQIERGGDWLLDRVFFSFIKRKGKNK
jgi:hypothetical protein